MYAHRVDKKLARNSNGVIRENLYLVHLISSIQQDNIIKRKLGTRREGEKRARARMHKK